MKKYITLIVFSLLVASTFTTLAQRVFYVNDSISMPEVEIPEVFVKSIKENREIGKLPTAVSLIGAAKIEQTEVQNLKDITAQVPNLFMPDYGSKLTSPIYIRGIGSRINSPSVGLYVDGVPYFEKSAFDFDFMDIDRIEVLRGPQGTLYGRNTMGGIINISTKSPIKYQGTQLNVSAGNYGFLKLGATHHHKVSNKLGFTVGAQMNHHNGYFTNLFTNEAADELNSYSGRGKVLWMPRKNISLEYSVSGEVSKQGGYPYAIVDKTTQKAGDVNYDHYSGYNRNMVSNGLTLKFEHEKYTLLATTSHQYYYGHQDIDQDFTPAALYAVVQDETQNMFSKEIIFRSNGETRYNWLFGAYGFRQAFEKTLEMDYGLDFTAPKKLPADYSYDKFYDNQTLGGALFHQSTLNDFLVEGLTLTAGIRADFETDKQEYLYEMLSNGNTQVKADTVYTSRTSAKVLPKVSLNYQASKQITAYATVAEGYKAGGYNTTFTTDEELTFDPENSWNYEVGLKTLFWNGKLNANLSVFYIDWKNQQVYQPVETGQGSYLANAGESESKGIEVELRAKPFKNLSLDASYGYTDAAFVKYIKNITTDLSGNSIPYVPNNTLFVNASYKIAMKQVLESVLLNANYRLVGEHFWDDENTFFQDSYGMLNGKISAQKGVFTLEFWGKNLLNSEYNAFYFQALGNNYVQKGRPTTVGMNLIVKF